jgi:hypothetical protein
MRPLPQSCLMSATLFLVVPLLGACSSMYYATMEKFGVEKRDILIDRVEEGREAQEDAKEQVKTTLERFKELTGFDGGELEDRYNQLNADYEACVDRAEDLTGRIDSIEDVAADMMEEMEEEIAQISKPEYRAESQKNLAIIRDRSSKMVSAMRQAEQRMAPVLQAFKDEVLRLKHNLNVQAIQSLSGTVSQIEGDVTKLIDDMNKSIAEADSFLASMNTQ